MATAANGTDKRIPATLAKQAIFAGMFKTYLETFDAITEYNKAVLATADSEWNPAKVLVEARKFASPENAEDADKEIKDALDVWEALVSQVQLAKRSVVDLTAKKLGITLTNTSEKDPEIEAPLKEKRKSAAELMNTMAQIAKITDAEGAGDAIVDFFVNHPLPAVGRDSAKVFGADGSTSAPKYRLSITVKDADGNELGVYDGFTKASQALSKPAFKYERGKSPKADTLREVYEKAGNSRENMYAVTPVTFEDNGLTYVIDKK